MSGTGKSSALAELARRGFRTVDTDEPGWTVEDADDGQWWDEKRILQLLAEDGPTLYMSGTVSNQGRFYDRFDAVVLLSRAGGRPPRPDLEPHHQRLREVARGA